MSLKIATQQRSINRINRSTARTASSTRPRPTGYQLQRTIGNATTSRLLKSNHIQAKLTVSNPGDASEREADRIAAEVMRMPEPQPGSTVQRSPINIQRSCEKCDEELKRKPILDKDEELVQAKPDDTSAAPAASSGLESYLNTSRGTGQPLPPSSRAYFEPRFGRDLSDVRVHSDGQASQAANSISAKAFTAGKNIVFAAGQYSPQTHQGQTLLAHELTHVVQQSGDGIRVDKTIAGNSLSVPRAVEFGTLQRTPAAPVRGDKDVPFDRSKIDVSAIPEIVLDTNLAVLAAALTGVSVSFKDRKITSYSSTLYDPADGTLSTSAINPIPSGRTVDLALFANLSGVLTQGRHILRCIGYDSAGRPVAYADRSFFIWRSKPTGKPPDIAALETEKSALEATSKVGSGKTFGEVASALAKVKDVTHDLSVLETGTGPFVGSICKVRPAGSAKLGCTNSVLLVLEETFTQQGRDADWDKVEKKIQKNITSRGKKATIEGSDIQAALQTEAGWKGIFWAPDPGYKIPTAELVGGGITGSEAGWALGVAKNKGIYKEKGRQSISIDYLVTNYAPEAPKPGRGEASKTTKDITQLDKLKKLPFGVLSAHGATHMAFITYGTLIEVHWDKEATDVDLIERTDFEKWAVGPESGYHFFASGAIVAPAEDVDAAFK